MRGSKKLYTVITPVTEDIDRGVITRVLMRTLSEIKEGMTIEDIEQMVNRIVAEENQSKEVVA